MVQRYVKQYSLVEHKGVYRNLSDDFGDLAFKFKEEISIATCLLRPLLQKAVDSLEKYLLNNGWIESTWPYSKDKAFRNPNNNFEYVSYIIREDFIPEEQAFISEQQE